MQAILTYKKKKQHGWNEKDTWIQTMKAVNLENCYLQLSLPLSINQKIFEWMFHFAYFHGFKIFAFAQYNFGRFLNEKIK